MQNIVCLFLHKSYSFAIKRPKMTKNKLISFFVMGGGGCPPSLPCTVEAACTVLASLSFQCPSLHFNVYIKLWVSTFWTEALRNKVFVLFFFGANNDMRVITQTHTHTHTPIEHFSLFLCISHTFAILWLRLYRSAVFTPIHSAGNGVSFSLASHFLSHAVGRTMKIAKYLTRTSSGLEAQQFGNAGYVGFFFFLI